MYRVDNGILRILHGAGAFKRWVVGFEKDKTRGSMWQQCQPGHHLVETRNAWTAVPKRIHALSSRQQGLYASQKSLATGTTYPQNVSLGNGESSQ